MIIFLISCRNHVVTPHLNRLITSCFYAESTKILFLIITKHSLLSSSGLTESLAKDVVKLTML